MFDAVEKGYELLYYFQMKQIYYVNKKHQVASLYSEWYPIFEVCLIKGKFEKSLFFNWLFFFHYLIQGCSFYLLSSCKSNKHINLPFTISHLISTNVLGQRHANFFESWWKHHGGISIFWQLLLTEVNLEICIWENLA